MIPQLKKLELSTHSAYHSTDYNPHLLGRQLLALYDWVSENESGTVMTESLNQKEFNQLIMQIALAVCFKPYEEFLSEDQILARNYTPTENFGRSCIASLIDSGKFEFTRVDPAFPLDGNECTLFIKNPVSAGDDFDGYIYRLAENIVDALIDFEPNSVYLKALRQEVLACECVEYCEYYAKREQLPIANPNHNNARLRLLLLECKVDIVYMLMWRAIKH
jgi:hypothetical protein